jgi:hypothetical protein
MKKTILFNIFIGISILLILVGALPPIVQAANSAKLTIASCKILYAGPKIKLDRGGDFGAVWKVKNTADLKWNENDVDYKYVSGKKMVRAGFANRYDLPETVKAGEDVTLWVQMTAPLKKGTYTTTWQIVLGNKKLCSLPLTVHVR